MLLRTTDYLNMKKIILLFLVCILALSVNAQDQHFTQFYAAPLALNPAMTGNFAGRYRVGMIYRDQWRGVFDQPYKTFSAAVDVRFDIAGNTRYKDAVGIGLMFFSDQVGGIDFETNQIALSGSFHKSLGYEGSQTLSGGIQMGLTKRSIGYEQLNFDDQFNSIDGFILGTGENLPPNIISFSDLNVGLNYTLQLGKKTVLNVGGSMHHVLQPNVSFYPDIETPGGVIPGGDSKLYARYGGQLSLRFPVGERMSLIPRALFSKQGPHMELTAGSNIRVPIDTYSGNAIQFGFWARPVSNEDDSFSLDALIAMIGMEWKGVLFGLSYDVNLDDLTVHQQGQQSFEFSILYLGDFDNESILCPKF